MPTTRCVALMAALCGAALAAGPLPARAQAGRSGGAWVQAGVGVGVMDCGDCDRAFGGGTAHLLVGRRLQRLLRLGVSGDLWLGRIATTDESRFFSHSEGGELVAVIGPALAIGRKTGFTFTATAGLGMRYDGLGGGSGAGAALGLSYDIPADARMGFMPFVRAGWTTAEDGARMLLAGVGLTWQ